jgi:uncharacterized protein (TIGR02001 family)
VTPICSRGRGRLLCVTAAAALVATAGAGPALAQQPANQGAVSFSGGLDVPSVYLFRGILQESDPRVTLWPYGELGVSLFSGDGGLKSVDVSLGIWNSLHTGSSGTQGPSQKLQYEQDFYAGLAFGLGGGLSVGGTYTAYTSPNAAFSTVKELSVDVSHDSAFAPYALVAFELDGQADGGAAEGTYLELGVGPEWELAAGRLTLGVPVKVGLSLSDYYEGPEGHETFGYFSAGGLLTLPLTRIPGRFGSWSLHGGVDLLVFGDAVRGINGSDRGKVVGLFGLGLSY